jgi:hypothetical protein
MTMQWKWTASGGGTVMDLEGDEVVLLRGRGVAARERRSLHRVWCDVAPHVDDGEPPPPARHLLRHLRRQQRPLAQHLSQNVIDFWRLREHRDAARRARVRVVAVHQRRRVLHL